MASRITKKVDPYSIMISLKIIISYCLGISLLFKISLFRFSGAPLFLGNTSMSISTFLAKMFELGTSSLPLCLLENFNKAAASKPKRARDQLSKSSNDVGASSKNTTTPL